MTDAPPPPAARLGRWTALAVAVGLLLRAFHYLRGPSVWHDEAALLVNVLDLNFGEQLGPLIWAEAAPPLFLWAERAVALALGDGIFALRLLPFLASCLALLLVAGTARRLLPPAGALAAVLIFAGSDRLLWHACEAKPYALDVLLAAALPALYLWGQGRPLGPQLALLAVLSPVAVWLCFPGAFLCGAALAALLPRVWRERRPAVLLGYAAWAAGVFAAFALLALGPARAQRCGALESCWADQFPDWSRPGRVPAWAALSALEVARYCFKPLGQAYAPLAAVGAVAWWRSGRRALAALLLGPPALALLAACLYRYPFGASRLEVFAAPALALLSAAGLAPTAAALRPRWREAPAGLAALLATAPLLGLASAAAPWDRQDCGGAAAYVLGRLRGGDTVIANKWEYVYYFRRADPPAAVLTGDPADLTLRQPKRGRLIGPGDLPAAGRCWVLMSEDGHAARDLLAGLPWFTGRRLRERREFERTTVYLLDDGPAEY
jgi:hypothetical protein